MKNEFIVNDWKILPIDNKKKYSANIDYISNI